MATDMPIHVSLLLFASSVALPRISSSATMSTEKNIQKSATAGGAVKKTKMARAKRDQPDEAEASSLPLEVEALDVLLKVHATSSKHKLLSLRECGRLSITNKAVSKICEDAGIWKHIFEETAEMGKKYQSEMRVAMSARDAYDKKKFCMEDGLLDCFLNPDERIVQRCGYKKLAGCLRGKSCFRCGNGQWG